MPKKRLIKNQKYLLENKHEEHLYNKHLKDLFSKNPKKIPELSDAFLTFF